MMNEIIANLSLLISQEIRTLRSEESAPVHGADEMDDIIKTARENIVTLRRIRQELEDMGISR